MIPNTSASFPNGSYPGSKNPSKILFCMHAIFMITRGIKISQLVNKMCSHCLFPVVDKSGTSCYHLVTMLMTVTDSQQRNKLLTS